MSFTFIPKVIATGTTLTTTSSSQSSAIPNMSNGNAPKFVRVAADGNAFIKFGASGLTATGNDILVHTGNEFFFTVTGCTYFAVIEDGSACKVNVTALENY